MKNVKITVTGSRAAGATTAAYMIAQYFESIGLTVVHSGDTIVVSGEVPPPEPQQAMAMEAPSKPQSVLALAHQIVHGDREQTYGDAGKNFRTIAAYWNTHIQAAKSIEARLTEEDVCGMMVLLKQARLANSPGHRDSLVDIVGYTELNDIIQQQKVKS
jgi:hypothetical protein